MESSERSGRSADGTTGSAWPPPQPWSMNLRGCEAGVAGRRGGSTMRRLGGKGGGGGWGGGGGGGGGGSSSSTNVCGKVAHEPSNPQSASGLLSALYTDAATAKMMR